MLAQQIESISADEIRLRCKIIIGVHAGSFRTIRGRSLLAVVGDETSYWRDEASAQPYIEIFRACAPALAATKGVWIGISTGYRKIGLLYNRWRDYFGQNSDDVLVVQGSSQTFNPSLSADIVQRAREPTPKRQSRNGAVVSAPTSQRSSTTPPSKGQLTSAAPWNCRPCPTFGIPGSRTCPGDAMMPSRCASGTKRKTNV